MGSDGYLGIKKLKENHNVYTIAQTKDTCVVYGMPKVVISHNLADNVLPIDLIGNEINNKVASERCKSTFKICGISIMALQLLSK